MRKKKENDLRIKIHTNLVIKNSIEYEIVWNYTFAFFFSKQITRKVNKLFNYKIIQKLLPLYKWNKDEIIRNYTFFFLQTNNWKVKLNKVKSIINKLKI